MSATIEAVRGMRDVSHAEQRRLAYVRTSLEEVLASHGYQPIDLPIVEHRDLYLRKLGEELVGKIYEFNFGGRELALRPEWTASILRAYVAHMQDQPLPVRLSYCGPVFRYERPQRSTYRQFTQIGVELVGGPAPRSDAEIIALACTGLDTLGVTSYHVTLGHIGLIREICMHLGLAERTQGLLIWNLERLRSYGVDWMRTRLDGSHEAFPLDPSLFEGLSDEQANMLLLRTLQAMQINLNFGTRPPEAIVSRLVRKLRRDDPQPNLERALALLERLCRMRGAPSVVFPQVVDLLEEYSITTKSLDELRAIVALLDAYDVPAERMVVDFGLGRGLQYYTGLIFEMYDAGEMQLCGGGRYDDLVQGFGGRQPVPAVGFAYGLERIAATLPASADIPRREEVLVVAVSEAEYSYGLTVARRLRARGAIVSVDVRGRTLASNLRDAARRGTDYVAIVGAQERERHELVWRNLHTREEQRLRLENL